MTIFQEIDRALHVEAMKLATAPRDTQFLIVLSSEARNDLFREFREIPRYTTPGKTLCEEKYLGNVIAVTADETMPRVSIFTKVKQAADG